MYIVCCVAAVNLVCLCTNHGQVKVETCSVGFCETKRIFCLFYCFLSRVSMLMHAMRNIIITGCAVAQHCYNGDVSFLREKLKL